MSSGKKILASALIIGLSLIGACKKSEVVEEPPVNNKPTISGEYNNETTGDKLILEVNDMIYAKGIGKIAASRPYDGFTGMGIALYDDDKRVFDITSIGIGKQLDIAIEGSSQLKGSILEEKQYTIKLDYSIVGSNGDLSDHQLDLGTADVKFEKDYSWGTEKNQTIYDNRDAIAEIMARNMSSGDGKDRDKAGFINVIEIFYNPTSGFAVGTDLFDTVNKNTFQFRWATGGATFRDATEKDVYDLRKIIGE